jgi:hypothetical protein
LHDGPNNLPLIVKLFPHHQATAGATSSSNATAAVPGFRPAMAAAAEQRRPIEELVDDQW